MNPQYMQQQPPYYGAPNNLPPRSGLSTNLPPAAQFNGSDTSQGFAAKNPIPGPPMHELPPPLQQQQSSQYANNSRGPLTNVQQPTPGIGQPPHMGQPMANQNNLANQMSNLKLGNQQRPPSAGFPPQVMKSSPGMPLQTSNINGYNSQSEQATPIDSTAQSQFDSLPGGPLPTGLSSGSTITSQPGPPISQPPAVSGSAVGTQYARQMPAGNIGSQFPGQILSGQQNLPGPHVSGHKNLPGPPSGQPNLSGPMPPGHQSNLSGPLQQQQTMSGPPISGQQNLSGLPLSSQPNLAGPPNQAHLGGPPLPGQSQPAGPHMPAPLMQGQQQYLSGPPLPGQQSMVGPHGISRQPTGTMPPYQQQGYPQQVYTGQPDMYGGQRSPYQGAVPPPAGPGGFQPGMQPGAQPQQQRRLDPDHMPSPIQVMLDDQQSKGGPFVTNQKGLVPPLVTTNFTTQDQGHASPRFIRSTMYTIPTTTDILKQTSVPFGLIISPMAKVAEGEYDPPIVDMGEIGPVRCIRCKAYMSPFMSFIDAGRRFQCMFCKATTEVPAEYFQHLDHTGQRMDRYERPELVLGTYEFVATKDYCRNNTFPKPPALIFVIDVSYNNIKSGLVHLLCSEMKRIVRNFPVDAGQTRTNVKVGFITYNNTVHFYNIKACLAQPQMMVVGDVQEVFMPLLDGFLCDAEESESVIDSLMTQIPAMFADTRETETILGPAIQAGLEALKASDCTGKLIVFHSTLPIAEAPGKLKNRDDRKLLGTEKEKTILAPQTNVYNNLGQECVGAGCSVDLFIFNNSYIDIATIGQVARLTGGEVFKYTYFQADLDGERLITDIINNIKRPIAFDAIMRVRTSTGVRATDFYGHFFMSNTTDMELASIDSDKAVAIEIKHDDKLVDEEGVYIQVALLYTSCSGIRRLRVINLGLRTSSQMAELYRACDLDAIVNFFSKQSVFKLIEASPKAVKDNLISRCATMLAVYRKHCASPSSAGQLILPECMKLLPLYVNSILKSDAISGGADMTIDDRSFVMQAVATMDIPTSVAYFYPRLLPLHDVDPQSTEMPQMVRCSIDKFTEDGAYLLENGIHMFLWLGLGLSSQWVQAVFGVPSVGQVDVDRTVLPTLDTPLNHRVVEIITQVRSQRYRCMRLTIVRQREKLEMVMRHFLVEDRGGDGSASYVDFLCHMHKEIRTLLS
ncbi:protein transport protein Sec24C [Athalia rosae]|uniref:protein transport protein Sec24C n=1 Tax=Athalia rosae TaxID=37344 RepID=UPI002033BA29|nr:protein transport protein Sec24C [Athalia rosae]XP_048512386.1 protein transport protein Sec24C [Athalia rosae]